MKLFNLNGKLASRWMTRAIAAADDDDDDGY